MFARERHEPKNVLVVEDSADDVELLLIAARTAPDVVSFHMVKDGEQALAYLKGEGQFADRKAHPLPHLVLLDLSLPGMDGFESWPGFASTPSSARSRCLCGLIQVIPGHSTVRSGRGRIGSSRSRCHSCAAG
jgi:PleD family two-component response regulator